MGKPRPSKQKITERCMGQVPRAWLPGSPVQEEAGLLFSAPSICNLLQLLKGPHLAASQVRRGERASARGRKNTGWFVAESRGLTRDQGFTERREWQLASGFCDSKPVLFGFWSFQSISFLTVPRYIHLFNQSSWARLEIPCLERWWPATCFYLVQCQGVNIFFLSSHGKGKTIGLASSGLGSNPGPPTLWLGSIAITLMSLLIAWGREAACAPFPHFIRVRHMPTTCNSSPGPWAQSCEHDRKRAVSMTKGWQ